MMIIMNSFLWDWFLGSWDWVTDPLWAWYFYGALTFVVGGAIIYFLGGITTIRNIVGFAILGVGIYIAGGRHMHNQMKGQVEELKKKQQEEYPPWKWPWET